MQLIFSNSDFNLFFSLSLEYDSTIRFIRTSHFNCVSKVNCVVSEDMDPRLKHVPTTELVKSWLIRVSGSSSAGRAYSMVKIKDLGL